MNQKMSRQERKEVYLKVAGQFFDEMEDWYDENEEATFEEIESQVRPMRRQLMGESLAILIQGRETGAKKQHCLQCGEKMRYKGDVSKTIYGLEGDTTLKRERMVCKNGCEQAAFFPSGQETSIEK